MSEAQRILKLHVGALEIGGGAPVSIQSMTNTDTKNVDATVQQILAFEAAGCDLSRSAINSQADAEAIPEIQQRTHIPFVSDIQFDPELALLAVAYGTDALRINPGNLTRPEDLARIVAACRARRIPIRVGVNSGSLHKDVLARFGGVNAESLVYSALEEVRAIERLGYDQIAVSIKSSDVRTMIESNRLFRHRSPYPLHLGVTEAGPPYSGTIKSAVGIGVLLEEGIGETIRVSLTGNPVEEVRAGMEILKSLGLKKSGINLISCPTCARTRIDLIGLVEEAEQAFAKIQKNLTVAIMGCPVNGPGEAKEADIGVACSKDFGVLFKKGKPIRQVRGEDILSALLEEIDRMES